MGSLPVTLYSGDLFDNNSSGVGPLAGDKLAAVWCFCSSPEYREAVRRIDQNTKVTNATLVKVPFDLKRWHKVAKELYPNGLPDPYSNDPTQWIFHGHPCRSVVWDEIAKRTIEGPVRIDANDGVRLNIRPFLADDIPGGKKGGGILRSKPNVHWRKDRGKEPPRDESDFPWFWADGHFAGERVNDLHFSNAEKCAARHEAQR